MMFSSLFSSLYLTLSVIYSIVSLLLLNILGPIEGIVNAVVRRLGIQRFLYEHQVIVIGLGYVCVFGSSYFSWETPQEIGAKLGLGILGMFLYLGSVGDINDNVFKHPDRQNFVERWFKKHMLNPMDVFHIQRMGIVTWAVMPLFLSFFLPVAFNWFAVLLFLRARFHTYSAVENLLHQEMHTLYLRTKKTSHTPFQRAIFELTRIYLIYVLSPMVGNPPNFYTVHHMRNHHRENNGLEDVTTLVYCDRTSFFDFCRMSFRFMLSWGTGYDLLIYLYRRKDWKQMQILAFGLLFFYGIFVGIYFVQPIVAVILLVRQLSQGVGLAMSLWFWHAFQNNQDPENVYQNSLNVLFDSYTNNGYHIEHHKRGNVHWSKYPENVVKDIPRYLKEKSLVMRGFQSQEQLFYLIFFKKFDIIATHVVNFSNQPWSKEEIARLLEERTKPLHPQSHSAFYRRLERGVLWISYLLSRTELKTPQVNYDKDHVEPWSEKLETFFPQTQHLRPFPITKEYASAQ